MAAVPRALSKSKLLALRQCRRRLWLEVHKPELRTDSASARSSFRIGHDIGELARRLYDPAKTGTLVDLESEGIDAALARRQLKWWLRGFGDEVTRVTPKDLL